MGFPTTAGGLASWTDQNANIPGTGTPVNATEVNKLITEINAITDTIGASAMALSYFAEDPATTTSLTWGYQAAKIRQDNVVRDVVAGTVSLTNNSTNYVEFDVGLNTMLVNVTDFTTGRMPIAKVVTSGGFITGTVTSRDQRSWMNVLDSVADLRADQTRKVVITTRYGAETFSYAVTFNQDATFNDAVSLAASLASALMTINQSGAGDILDLKDGGVSRVKAPDGGGLVLVPQAGGFPATTGLIGYDNTAAGFKRLKLQHEDHPGPVPVDPRNGSRECQVTVRYGNETLSFVYTFTQAPIMSALTASKPVFTDGSKALTSSGTVPIDQGGTGAITAILARAALGLAIGSDVQGYSANAAFRTDKLSAFAATTSAELAGVISDETGTGKAVFGTKPSIINGLVLTPQAGGFDVTPGLVGYDNTAAGFKRLKLQHEDHTGPVPIDPRNGCREFQIVTEYTP